MEHLEIEIKFFIENVAPVRDKIVAIGGKSAGRHFEHNIVYDTRDGRLRKQGALLRLRKYRNVMLTYKSAPGQPSREYKIRNEWEVEVENFSTMNQILELIGYHRQFVYEKWREIFVMGNTHLCMDTLPYGEFLEIEGEKEDIREIAAVMGLNWESRILANYHSLFERLRRDLSLSFGDITFDQFRKIDITPADCRRLFIP